MIGNFNELMGVDWLDLYMVSGQAYYNAYNFTVFSLQRGL